MEMLQNMTTLLESVAARRNAADVPYIEIAGNNLMFALGKQLEVSSTGGKQIQRPSSGDEANVSNCTQLLLLYLIILF